MKALKITLSHGRVWTVETSSGARSQSSTLEGALEDLVPAGTEGAFGYKLKDVPGRWLGVKVLMESIPDSGGDGNIGRGRAAG